MTKLNHHIFFDFSDENHGKWSIANRATRNNLWTLYYLRMRLDANGNDDHCPRTHPVSRKNYSSTEANISLWTLSSSSLSRWIKRSLTRISHYNRPTFCTVNAIRPIYPNRRSLCIFVESHATGSRASMEATTFIRSMSTLYAANYLFVRHLFEWCSRCLMNRISFHWSRSWINIFFLVLKHARET